MSRARRDRAAALRYLRAGARLARAARYDVLRWRYLGQHYGGALLEGERWEVRAASGLHVYTDRAPDVLVPLDRYARWVTAHPAPLGRRLRGKGVRRGR